MPPPTTVCTDNNWAELIVKRKIRYYNDLESFPICVLPDGNYYYPHQLKYAKNDRLKHLFDQYSGQYPTFEQIEEAKEQMRKNGYIVD
ncbi:hypothetical protein [Neisseria sp. Ec49-e6-T10]|uniref:hypothetical protein n=1 Tax=Neisseria sp. Ec49-e6-T10 TaxID=3140744 RepID=UPI003EBCFB3C